MAGGVCFGAFVLLASFFSLSCYKGFPDIAVSHSTVLYWDQNSLAKQRKPLTDRTSIGHLCPQLYSIHYFVTCLLWSMWST